MDSCQSKKQHSDHLCKLITQGMHQRNPEEYRGLVSDPQFVCKNCGRVANQKTRLCNPVALGTWEE